MPTDVDSLLAQALALSEQERATIAGALIESLESEVDEDARAAWDRELEKRLQDLDDGSVTPVPWSMVRDRLLGRN